MGFGGVKNLGSGKQIGSHGNSSTSRLSGAASQGRGSEIQSDKGEKMRRLFSIRSLLGFIGFLLLSGAAYAQVDVGIAVSFGPPELPVYEQPICPGQGYILTPGHSASHGDDSYCSPW